jgi:BolA protein
VNDTKQRLEEIRRRIETAVDPEELVVEDEGHLHVGHEGARDGRGHFRVFVVAPGFEGLSQIQRHRLIYQAMGDLMNSDIHALSIDAYSSKEI